MKKNCLIILQVEIILIKKKSLLIILVNSHLNELFLNYK